MSDEEFDTHIENLVDRLEGLEESLKVIASFVELLRSKLEEET